jgi:hypothetical protein
MLWSQYKLATIRRTEFLCKKITGIPNIPNGNSNFLTLQTLDLKKNPAGIFGIKNGSRILLPMGVPEIGTKNQNSQPSPHPLRCLPPSLPLQSLPPPSPSLSLTQHPCCHCHCSCHHRCRHRHRLPPLLPPQSPSLSPLPSLACHPCCRRAALGGGGEDHTNPVHNSTSAATIGATIIVATFAARATGREGPVQ